MEALFNWMSTYPWAGYLVSGLAALLVFTVVGAHVVALRQGREITWWPPRIGPLPVSVSNETQAPAIDIGLIGYGRDSQALGDKPTKIRNAKQEVWLIGATMHTSLQGLRSAIIQKVQDGLSVHVLVADPNGLDFAATARSFGQSPERLGAEAEMTLAASEDIRLALRDPKGTFELRLVDRVFAAGVYFFDPQAPNGTLLLVPHIPGHDAPAVPGLLFRKTQGGLLDDYFPVYKAIWNGTPSRTHN